jgi:hypothetical protein
VGTIVVPSGPVHSILILLTVTGAVTVDFGISTVQVNGNGRIGMNTTMDSNSKSVVMNVDFVVNTDFVVVE